jgi:exopolyphosphatase / guanosine-5'-triphosphate,3'-diphosphate pyrophosphatase
MTTIVPRWEWRAFGRSFGTAEDAFAAMTPERVQESDERYLVSPGGENVKVRDDLMDIKVLREVNADGLERWEPVMKAAFPLSTEVAAQVFDALGHAPPPLASDAYPLDRFLSELVESASWARVARVHKRRVRYTVGGCLAELSDVRVDGAPIRTVAIESEDPAAVVAAVREVGLGGWANTSYPRALGRILDAAPERFAAIDVGTNSVKFHVGERAADGSWSTIVDRAEITRLGEGLQERGEIAPGAADRTVSAIAGMVEEARTLGTSATAIVGTAGLRVARNGEAVTGAILERVGIPLEVIPGDEESRLGYLAVASGLGVGAGSVAIFDTGGGSTEFTFGHGDAVDEHFSLDVGAVGYTERYGLAEAVPRGTLDEVMAEIAQDLGRLDGHAHPDALVGMGGAITNLTAVRHELGTYDPDVVQGSVLDLAEIDRQIERYASLDADGRRGIVGLQPRRADVILAGACIVRSVMDQLGQEALTVSDRGLRHGLLLDRFG